MRQLSPRPSPVTTLAASLALSALLGGCGGGITGDAPAAPSAQSTQAAEAPQATHAVLAAQVAAAQAAAVQTPAAVEPVETAEGTEAAAPTMSAMAVKAATTVSVVTSGWSTWTKNLKPTFAGPYSLIGDPSVVRDGTTLRMAYNCYDPMRHQGAVCEALSTDGLTWKDAPVNDGIAGRVIQSRAGQWDDTHETPLIYKFGKETLLFFSGYVNKGGFFNSFPASLGLATSTDGVKFTRYGTDPVIKPTPGGYDNDAVFSPSITEYNGQLVMIYTGHCWTNCKYGMGVTLLAATSTDGRTWTKVAKPIMTKADLPFTKDGAAEADIVKGPDGYYYLFMSLLYGDNGSEIGVARSASPMGPWDINPSPIVKRTAGQFDDKGPIAPSVLIENGKVRMWFHGFGSDNTIRIGYAEAPWPLRKR